jgi:hypothetical protein
VENQGKERAGAALEAREAALNKRLAELDALRVARQRTADATARRHAVEDRLERMERAMRNLENEGEHHAYVVAAVVGGLRMS